jgi:hypothetical protein
MSRYKTRIWGSHLTTVGGMKAENVPVFAHCSRCDNSFKVDLDLLIAAHGGAYSLVNREDPCHLRGCDGTMHYLAQPGAGMPFRTLRD